MTLIQMQYFQTVCKYENFTRAAEELHMSQPAISAAIRDLERECRVPLFVRDKNSLKVTEQGEILLKEVELLLSQYRQMNTIIEDLSLTRKFVRIGFSTLSGNHVYSRILTEYQKMYPDIEVMSVEESTKRQFELLDAERLDLIITIMRQTLEQQKQFDKIYGHYPLMETSMAFCVGKDNPLAGESYVTPAQMASQPLILLKDNFNQTRRIREMFRKFNLEYQVLHYTSQMYTIERFVENNSAAGFLPIEVACSNPKIRAIPYDYGKGGVIEIFWRKDHYLFPAAKDFIEVVKKQYPLVQSG